MNVRFVFSNTNCWLIRIQIKQCFIWTLWNTVIDQLVYLNLGIVSIMLILRHAIEPFNLTKSYWIHQAWIKILLTMLGKSRCDLRFVENIKNISSNYALNSWLFNASKCYLAKKLLIAQQALSISSQSPLKRHFAKKPQHVCMLSLYYYYYFFRNRKSALNKLKSQKVYLRFEIHNL